MEIPFFQKKGSTGEVYCGILLKETKGVCFLFTKTATEVVLTAQQSFTYSDGWERIIEDVDEALAILEQGKEASQRATHCIFFLYSHLIDPSTKEVAKPYIGKMRELVKSLEFKPVGYIEVIDAVHDHLEKKRQTQLSSIVIEIDDHFISAFLYKGGHKIFAQCVERSESFARDVEHALQLKQEQHVFPTQMYLYDSEDLHKESSALLMHNWSKDAFIHPPRTTIIQPEEITHALTALLNKQLCGAVPNTSFEDKDEEQKKEVMGFVVGEDITQKNTKENVHIGMPKVSFRLPAFQLPALPRMPIIPIVFGVIVLLGTVAGLLYYLHKATVLVRIPTATAKDTVLVTANSKPDTDEVLLSSVVTSFAISDKKETTGKKDIGEKAGGEVSLYSYEEKEVIIPKGKKLTVGSTEFETDGETALPPAQFAGDGITKNPGKSKVKVRASLIGTEGNLEKGKRFTIDGYSSNVVFAINDSALTGGTKKTVRTIAKADLDSIRSAITDRVKKTELAKFKNNVDHFIVPDLTDVEIKKEEFSGEIGEEATTITYKMSGDVTIFQIPQLSIRDAVQQKLEAEKKEGFTTDFVRFEIANQKEDKNTNSIALTVQGEAVFSKKYEEDKLKNILKGSKLQSVQEVLSARFGLTAERVVITPSIPLLQDHLPFFTHNIEIETLK